MENTIYKHPAWLHTPKPILERLTCDVNKFNTFNGEWVRLGERIRDGREFYASRKGKTDPIEIGNEALGDIFEAVMGEHFIHYFGHILGAHRYEIETEHDWGVDGKGIGNDGKRILIQLKGRSDAKTILTHLDGIDNTVEESIYKYGVSPLAKNGVLLVTNANSLLWKDRIHRYKGFVSYITPNESWGLYHGKKYTSEEAVRNLSIRQLVDSTLPFWDSLRTFISSLP